MHMNMKTQQCCCVLAKYTLKKFMRLICTMHNMYNVQCVMCTAAPSSGRHHSCVCVCVMPKAENNDYFMNGKCYDLTGG